MDVYVIVGGKSYNVNDGTLGYLSGHDGLGLPPLHRIAVRGPLQHGETDVGFRLDPRYFSLLFTLPASNNNIYYQNRAALLRYIKPMNTELKIRFVLDNGDVRQIDAYTVEAPWAFDASEIYLLGQVAVQYTAPDPTFYDPTQQSVVFALSITSSGFTIPLPIPWPIGASGLDQVKTVTYTGTFISHPVVTIVGPITDAVVQNLTTDEKLDFSGVTIGAGDYYEIDCRYGQQTVVDSNGVNKSADLTDDSDLSTFHLESPPDGSTSLNNDFRVTGSGVTSATEVYIQYYTRFVGL